MDSILIRKDVQNKVVVFFPDSYMKDAHKITYWDGEHGHKKQETSADYYFTSKPVDEAAVAETVKKFNSNFGNSPVIIRHRLYKESALRKPVEGVQGDTKATQQEFAEKLIKAITKAIREAVPT